MDDKKCFITICGDTLHDSKKSINFRDTTPLYRTMNVVCAIQETLPDGTMTGGIVFREPLDVRWYWGSGETCRCIVWFRYEGRMFYGVGSAGGGGYDKVQASFMSALQDMGLGVRTKGNVGWGADVVAREIAEVMGYKHIHVVEGHR